MKSWATSVLWETPQDLSKAYMLLNVLSGIQQQTASYSFDLKNTSVHNVPVAGALVMYSVVQLKQIAQYN